MKTLLAATLAILISGGVAWGAGSSVDEQSEAYSRGGAEYVEVTFTCVSDDTNGTIADTAMLFDAKGWYLYNVETAPGGTAPDAADVLIKNAAGRDLLDGNGTNLIHASAVQSMSDAMPYFELVTGTLTLDVDNQATNDALYTVKLTFIK